MYQSYFHLHDRPFSSAANPEHYFPTASIEQARESIARNIERSASVTMVTGAIGCGKTLLCQLIANQYAGELPACLIHGENIDSPEELLQAIMRALGLPFHGQDEGELRLNLENHITSAGCVKGILLIVDDAERLSTKLLSEIRAITNIVRDGRPCARIVLVGSPRLEENIVHPDLESLNQRIVGRLYLDNFSCQDSADYVRARIAACGGDSQTLFTEQALVTVHRATNGVPRLVNQICDHALVLGSLQEIDQISGRLVEETWADLQQLPMPTRDPEPADEVDDREAVIEFGLLDETSEAKEWVDVERSLADLSYAAAQAARPMMDSRDIEFGDEHENLKAPFMNSDIPEVEPDDLTEQTFYDSMEQHAWTDDDAVQLAPDFDTGESPEASYETDDATEDFEADLPSNERTVIEQVLEGDNGQTLHGQAAGLRIYDGRADEPTNDQAASLGSGALPPAVPFNDIDSPEFSHYWTPEVAVASPGNNELASLGAALGKARQNAAEDASDGTNSTLDQVENPFGGPFAEEEIVLQEFISPSSLLRDAYDPVTTAYSQQLAVQLAAAHPGLRMHPACEEIETRDFEADEFQPLSACLDGDRFVAEAFEDTGLPMPISDLAEAVASADGCQDPVLPEPTDLRFEDAPGEEKWESEELSPKEPLPDEHDAARKTMEHRAELKEEMDDIAKKPTVVIARIEASENPKPCHRRFRQLFSAMRSKTISGKD